MTHQDLEIVNISFRVYVAQQSDIKAAAELAKLNVSDYCRPIVFAQVAKDLGRPMSMPHRPSKPGVLVGQAAAALGITRKEFEERAIAYAVAGALGGRGAPPSESGLYRATPAAEDLRPHKISRAK